MKDDILYFVDFGLEHISFLACKIKNSYVDEILFFQEKEINIPIQRTQSVFNQTKIELLINIIDDAERELKTSISEIILVTKDQSINLHFIQKKAEFKKTQKVSLSNMERLSMQCVNEFYSKVSNEYNILDVIFNRFVLDNVDKVKNPYKISCKSLTINASIVSIKNIFAKHFGAYLERYKVHVKHYISPCVSAYSLISDTLVDGDFLFIDIGSCVTEFCVIQNGCIVYLDKIALGGLDMTRDVAHEMQICVKDASMLKKQISDNNTIIEADNKMIKFKASQIEEILNARLQEIIAHIYRIIVRNKQLQNVSFKEIFVFGGVAKYKNIKQLIKQQFNTNVEFLDENYINNSEIFSKKARDNFLKNNGEQIQLLSAVNFYIKNINLYRNARRGFLFKFPSKISCLLKDLLY